MEKTQLHESGLNIIQNSDGSFAFEWDPKDKRWAWLNGLTDDQIKSIIEESVETRKFLESITDEFELRQGVGSDE
jgi:hypothetical protein